MQLSEGTWTMWADGQA